MLCATFPHIHLQPRNSPANLQGWGQLPVLLSQVIFPVSKTLLSLTVSCLNKPPALLAFPGARAQLSSDQGWSTPQLWLWGCVRTFCLDSSLLSLSLSLSRSAYHRSPCLCGLARHQEFLIPEALCFQQEPQHFPWAASDTFHGKFPFAGNSASNKNSVKNTFTSLVHVQGTGTGKGHLVPGVGSRPPALGAAHLPPRAQPLSAQLNPATGREQLKNPSLHPIYVFPTQSLLLY